MWRRCAGRTVFAETMARIAQMLAAAGAALVLAAGCGGGDDDASATEQWTSSACSAVNSWRSSVESIGDMLRANPTTAGAESAFDDLMRATQTLVDDLKGLGRPETEAGQEAQESVNALADDLDRSIQEMETAVDDASGASGVLAAISVVTGNLATMGEDVSSTVDSLQQLDGGEELRNAFEQADSCDDLRRTR